MTLVTIAVLLVFVVTNATAKKPVKPPRDDSIQLTSNNDFWPGDGVDNSGEDTVRGGDGDDAISGGLSKDYLYGENGEDILDGEEGDDYLNGGPGYDLLYGGPGNDRIDLPVFGETKMDFVDGGDGFDTLRLHSLEFVDLDEIVCLKVHPFQQLYYEVLLNL